MKRLHVFNCYRYDVRERLVVRADSHEQAAKIAARLRGWTESEIVTRYVITVFVKTGMEVNWPGKPVAALV